MKPDIFVPQHYSKSTSWPNPISKFGHLPSPCSNCHAGRPGHLWGQEPGGSVGFSNNEVEVALTITPGWQGTLACTANKEVPISRLAPLWCRMDQLRSANISTGTTVVPHGPTKKCQYLDWHHCGAAWTN